MFLAKELERLTGHALRWKNDQTIDTLLAPRSSDSESRSETPNQPARRMPFCPSPSTSWVSERSFRCCFGCCCCYGGGQFGRLQRAANREAPRVIYAKQQQLFIALASRLTARQSKSENFATRLARRNNSNLELSSHLGQHFSRPRQTSTTMRPSSKTFPITWKWTR